MYTLFVMLAVLLSAPAPAPPALGGSWQLTHEGGLPVGDRQTVAIFSDDYFTFGSYHPDGRFMGAGGGSYVRTGAELRRTFDFFTDDAQRVRREQTLRLALTDTVMEWSGADVPAQRWRRLPADETSLSGAWTFAARVDAQGQSDARRTPGPRQTVKMVGGGRFQWAAFNWETKEFMGTGGGTYRVEGDAYTETIAFFSRDDGRVGQSLRFTFERRDNDWYQRGTNSRGEPLHEIWTLR